MSNRSPVLLREPLPGMGPPPPRDDPLPAGWRWVRLGDICMQDRHVVPSGDGRANALPFLGLEHVESQSGRILCEPDDLSADAGTSTSFAFDARHVLYGKLRPYLNKVALPTFTGRCTTELIPLLPTGVDRHFLSLLLRRPETVEAAMRGRTGSRMPRADMDDLLACPVALPPLSVQRRIAVHLVAQLAIVDRARAAAQAQLEAADALRGSYLRAVFDGREAVRWPRRRLGDLSAIVSGVQKSPTRAPVQFHHPYLTVRNVQRGMLDLSEVERFEVTEAEFARLRLLPGDLLIVEGNGSLDQIGRNALFNGEVDDCIHQNHIIRVRVDQAVSSAAFLSYYLNSDLGRSQLVERARTTSGLYTLSTGKVASLEVPAPPLAVQQSVAGHLRHEAAAADRLRAKLQQQLASIDELPAALLRLAFAGKP